MTGRANWFVAWPVDAGDWLERVDPAPPHVRRFHRDDLHLTIAFLGAVRGEAAHRALDVRPELTWQPVEVVLGEVRLMGSPRRGSALSALVAEGEPPVVDWIARVRSEMLEAAGARPDPRPPLPHVTLARIQRRASPVDRRVAIDWANALDLGGPSVRLERPVLYTWSEERRARLFRVVATRGQ